MFADGQRGPSALWLTTLLFVGLSSVVLSALQASSPTPLTLKSPTTPEAQAFAEASGISLQRAELLERLGVRAWHERGWRGQGLKIAVLDSGFSGYRTFLGAALPSIVKVRSFRFDGNLEAKESQHGILCAEIIHSLAPEAEVLLANWEPERPDQFLAAVRWARQEGARILSCSIIMPTWSDCAGHGSIHEELSRLLRTGSSSGDALFFASAGNTAQRHWSGRFQDGGDGHHIWRDRDDVPHTENIIRPWGTDRVSVELCCGKRSMFEVTVADAASRKIMGRTLSTDAAGTGSAVVGFLPESGHEYRVRVRRVGKDCSAFHLVVLGGSLAYTCCQGSIPFPGDGLEVVAVGAVDGTGRRMAYSSCGNSNDDVKPDFVATVPFPSSWRARPFSGTSAAAPQGSALAALLWSCHSDWNASQIRNALREAAAPCAVRSLSWETGHGLLRLPASPR